MDVVDLEPAAHLAPVFDAADVVLHYEVARVFRWEREHHGELISPLCRKMMDRADRVGFDAYREAQAHLRTARLAHQRWLDELGLDALLTPAAPGEAPDIETTGDSVFNRTWTSLGVPAATLPAGLGPSGLPVGVQLTGRAWDDHALVRAANRVAEILGSDGGPLR